jgi:UDP-glucuronate 4-epimerase
MDRKKILVTGVAGFIGYHLAKKLCGLGQSVVGIDNLNDYYSKQLKLDRLSDITSSEFTFHELDIYDAVKLDLLFKHHKFDIVVNLAAQAGVRYSIKNPRAYLDSIIIGFGNILECCRNYSINHLVYASSSSVYGLNSDMPFSTSHNVDHPVSLYAASKKSNELMAHSYSHLYNLSTTGLRFFTVYGPWGRPDMAAFLFTDAIFNGKPIKVFNDGKMQRDFTFIDDIIDGVLGVIDHPPTPHSNWKKVGHNNISQSSAPYRIYNIGNNKPQPLGMFIGAIENAIGKKAHKIFLPMQDGDVISTYADIQDLNDLCGYTPNTDISEGVRIFVDWYRDYYGV